MNTPKLRAEPAPAQPLLSTSDRNSAAWSKLARHLESRLDTLRKQNDGPLDAESTANLRGRIAEIKALLEKGKDPIQPE